MAHRTAEESKQANIAAMGEDLGLLYSALWQSSVTIYFYWGEYVELFGTKPERIQLLNQAAPTFFRMLQDELWENCLLHLARLTDPAKSPGGKDRANLTIQALPELIPNAELRSQICKLIAEATKQTGFCRDWRNRRIAHRDLKLALDRPTTPLAAGSRLQVRAALDAIAAVLNAINAHYFESETYFDGLSTNGGALSLLYVLDDGLRARDLRRQRLKEGKPPEGDLVTRDL